jgi:hypothetical protein
VLPSGFTMSSPGHWNWYRPFARKVFTAGIWAMENTAMMIRYGAYALAMSTPESCGAASAASAPPAARVVPRSVAARRLPSSTSCAESLALLRWDWISSSVRDSPRSTSGGCHTRRNATIATAEPRDATTSVKATEM